MILSVICRRVLGAAINIKYNMTRNCGSILRCVDFPSLRHLRSKGGTRRLESHRDALTPFFYDVKIYMKNSHCMS